MSSVLASKRGVSPLIATVLLIAFAVALGSVVMNWGLNLGAAKQGFGCINTKIETREISSFEVCYGGAGQSGYINFTIDNTGDVDINGIAIAIIGKKGTKLYDIDGVTIRSKTLFPKTDSSVPYDFSTYGDITQVQFIPKIMSNGAVELCPQNAIKSQKIGQCT